MPENVYCYVPNVCIEDESQLATQVRSQLRLALNQGLKPIPIPANTRDVAINIDSELLKEVRFLAKNSGGLATGRVIGGLLYALHWSKRMADDVLDASEQTAAPLSPNTKGLKPGQRRVVEEAAPLLLNGKVVFSECGTGTGKARMISHLASFVLDARDQHRLPRRPYCERDWAAHSTLPEGIKKHLERVQEAHEQRLQALVDAYSPSSTTTSFFEKTAAVVACAPTIENVAHLVREWLAVRRHLDPQGVRRVGVRLGRAQFIDPALLELQLEESDPEMKGFPRVRKWLYAGMPAGATRASKAFLQLQPGLAGLMIDLAELARQDSAAGNLELDVAACALTSEVADADESAEHYTLHKGNAGSGLDLIFTTLAAVAMDNMMLGFEKSGGLLPPTIGALIIDEAHELEPTQANLAAHTLSLSNLRAALRRLEGHRSHKQLEHASARLQVLRTALEQMQNQQILPPSQGEPAAAQWQVALGEMVTLVEALEPICKKPRRTKRQPSAVELGPAQRKAMDLVERYLAVLKDVTSVKDWASRGVLSLSPIRHYVNLTFGPSTVARHLAARWHVTPCAMHLSGSLYHISSTGPNARFAAASVSALDRMAQTGSFMPSWLTSSPTLFLPGAERLHTLMPPPRDSATPTAMRYWLENVGAAIALAAKDAAGGTLVLMTGYERLNLLAQVIRDLHPELAGDRLVVQSPGTGVSSCADEFTRKSREGLRPIWLATGGAWTGLDLTDADKPADKDLLLTDLVIPGTPFGLDQNTTQMDRLRRMGFVAEIMVAQRKLRQGLGRLIRREGVQNRRIWMLDARILNPTTAHRFGDLRLVLQQYLKTERF